MKPTENKVFELDEKTTNLLGYCIGFTNGNDENNN